jgi:hypothetical protein
MNGLKNIRHSLDRNCSGRRIFWNYGNGNSKITSGKQEDLVFGIIILFVLMPIISGGMAVFGYYALTGEYSDDKI